MDKQKQVEEEMWTVPKTIHSRRDLASAEIVEKGIALQELYGTQYAAEFLKREMISMHVVMRVLSRRSERRNYGAQDHAGEPAPRQAPFVVENSLCLSASGFNSFSERITKGFASSQHFSQP